MDPMSSGEWRAERRRFTTKTQRTQRGRTRRTALRVLRGFVVRTSRRGALRAPVGMVGTQPWERRARAARPYISIAIFERWTPCPAEKDLPVGATTWGRPTSQP